MQIMQQTIKYIQSAFAVERRQRHRGYCVNNMFSKYFQVTLEINTFITCCVDNRSCFQQMNGQLWGVCEFQATNNFNVCWLHYTVFPSKNAANKMKLNVMFK